jgi:hypothetical protein
MPETHRVFISTPGSQEPKPSPNRWESTSGPNNLEPKLCGDHNNNRNHSNRKVGGSNHDK